MIGGRMAVISTVSFRLSRPATVEEALEFAAVSLEHVAFTLGRSNKPVSNSVRWQMHARRGHYHRVPLPTMLPFRSIEIEKRPIIDIPQIAAK
jgi:hypothetical protein